VNVAGRWRYVYRAVDQFGQVIDVFVAPRRDVRAARRFFQQAIGATEVTPTEVTTDRAPVYPDVLEALLPAAWHRTDQYANNRVECDHGRLKARLRPMRGLKQDRSARVIVAGHAFIQNARRVITSWRLTSQRAGAWLPRSRSWLWRSDPGSRSGPQSAAG
jgi:transposase-like protein